MKNVIRRIIAGDTDFEFIFFKNEFFALAGEKLKTILVLVGILVITFLGLGFAIGSLRNLEQKMDNPFTNWVNLNVSGQVKNKVNEILNRYESSPMKDSLQIRYINGFSSFVCNFYRSEFSPFLHHPDTLANQIWGRTIEEDEPLMFRILDKSTGNLEWFSEELFNEDGTINWTGNGIVVKSEMLKRLGYSAPGEVGYLGLQDIRWTSSDNVPQEVWMPVRVLAAVKELPNNTEFIAPQKLYHAINYKRDRGGKECRNELVIENREGSQSFVMLTDSPENAGSMEIVKLASTFFQCKPGIEKLLSFPSLERNWTGLRMSFLPTELPDLKKIRQFIDFSNGEGVSLNELSYVDYELDACTEFNPENLHYLAFHFDKLDKIRSFRDDMKEQFGIEIDMSQVESKENFALVSNLTMAVSTFLLGFSILSIAMFVTNLLRTHIFEVRSNLGTFQAFGLSDRSLIQLYMRIILSFLLIAIVVSYAFAATINLAEWAIMGKESKFHIFNLWILTAVVGLISISLALSAFSIRKILGDTPGNLIYER